MGSCNLGDARSGNANASAGCADGRCTARHPVAGHTAEGGCNRDLHQQDRKIVGTITFRNMGQLAKGYDDAHVTIIRSNLDGSKGSTAALDGTLTGGPNGVFSFDAGKDGGIVHYTPKDGKTVIAARTPMPVTNPEAFTNWPAQVHKVRYRGKDGHRQILGRISRRARGYSLYTNGR